MQSRVFPVLVVVATVTLLAILPGRYRLLPEWFLYVAGAAFVIPMLGAAFTSPKSVWATLEPIVIGIFAVIATANEVILLSRLASDIVSNDKSVEPVALLATAVGIWATNLTVFSLVYWQLDRGGTRGRSSGWNGWADFSFARGDPSEGFPANWQPVYADYLALAFNTSTAFSPTDTLPLTPRAKMLLMTQSLISLVTIVMVAARAINVLGT